MRGLYLCGGDFRPGPRDPCPNPLHDYPLPAGYVDAAETAGRRLARGWVQRRCRECGLFGWVRSGRLLGDGSDGPVAVGEC